MEDFPYCGEVVVQGLFFERGKGLACLPEEESDCFGRHDLDGFLWDRAGSVDDRYDNNEGKGAGSSKLVGFGAFGDTAEPVRSCDGHGGLCRFSMSSSSLISIAGRRWGAPKTIILSMEKSSIDGNQYLDCF